MLNGKRRKTFNANRTGIDEDTDSISHLRYEMEDLREKLQELEMDSNENVIEYKEIKEARDEIVIECDRLRKLHAEKSDDYIDSKQ